VSNAHGGPQKGTVSAFQVFGSGNLASIGDSPFPDHQTAPCWIEISHDGRYLFTVNTASASISRYLIRSGGRLALLGSTAMRGGTGLSPFDARLNPEGNMLFVVDSGAPAISAFAVEGGRLIELRSSPTALPKGAAPFGIAVN
jgi:6-phosphogluconolactonase (cycloisomerase 2 family)